MTVPSMFASQMRKPGREQYILAAGLDANDALVGKLSSSLTNRKRFFSRSTFLANQSGFSAKKQAPKSPSRSFLPICRYCSASVSHKNVLVLVETSSNLPQASSWHIVESRCINTAVGVWNIALDWKVKLEIVKIILQPANGTQLTRRLFIEITETFPLLSPQ